MKIDIQGARVHNLKDVHVSIPKEKLTVVTGLSGSGKSSLAFDTLYAEGQRRYVESLSSYARQFLGRLEKPDVDRIDGLSPAVAIEQRSATAVPAALWERVRRSWTTCACCTPALAKRVLRCQARSSERTPSPTWSTPS